MNKPASKPRYRLDALLARCDASAPISADDGQWLDARPIGAEVGAESDDQATAAKREAFRQDTLKAWADHQATGLHATAEEVDAWLASLGTDNELPPPACHT